MPPIQEPKKGRAFTRRLMHWHHRFNTRSLPWQRSREPYTIWLSEIILQQTRVAQGLPYYEKFIAIYPDIQSLAAAPDDAVLKLWEGLGYYTRCRNLLATARFLVAESGGIFPQTYEGLLRLKGVGAYTAAAIASFAYGLPHAVVDGNVFRVLARCFGIETPIDCSDGKNLFQALANQLIDQKDPGGFNQALMDLGATVCTPSTPDCVHCPLAEICEARSSGWIERLPQRRPKNPPSIRYFNYFLLRRGDTIWLRQRQGKDIWQGLYEPLLIETMQVQELWELQDLPEFSQLNKKKAGWNYLGKSRQRLSHQIIFAQCYCLFWPENRVPAEGGIWVPVARLREYAFPRTLTWFFNKLTTFK
ncbi:MAG: A/G-specific adenine glycosylase [Bacteroidetes bacterium]|nr:A/G-specific adenine glycosylase [Bacteroidota bacterium]